MMIDKKISVGTMITVLTVLGTFIYTQGIFANKIESIEGKSSEHSIKMNKNAEKIQELEVSVAKIETKIDEGFKMLETLFMEN
tara:strand:- start:288 stop:536 length:249 start_codon:yes stop_codon:yes gene_type:complete